MKPTPFKIFVGAICLMVAAAVIGGMYQAGSPAAERRRQIDVQRVNDLSQISGAVDSAYAADGHLPASLEALLADTTPNKPYYLERITDRVTGQPYEYRVLADATYELCASFDDATDEQHDAWGNPRPVGAPFFPGYRAWEHGAGRTCFELNAVSAMPTVACGVTNPCMAPNTTCAQLPGRGTFCVPQGKECLAAGCDESMCIIAESYPVQVRCTGGPAHGGEDGDEPTAQPQISCNLMRDRNTGEMGCFGCGGQVCTKPGPDWEHYESSGVGIPYSCYGDENGRCALAQ